MGISVLGEYLLCVLVVQVGYVIGEIAGKKPKDDSPLPRAAVMTLSILSSLIIGLVLYLLLSYILAIWIGLHFEF